MSEQTWERKKAGKNQISIRQSLIYDVITVDKGLAMETLETFALNEIRILNDSVTLAEELVSNFYKMSANQWFHLKYDVKTLKELHSSEIVHGPCAQVVRYEGKRQSNPLGSSTFDFYKICLQDHAILSKLRQYPDIKLFPFALYIVTHELIHVVRFCKFLQHFHASFPEKMAEESRVHARTREILGRVRSVPGLAEVLDFYHQWHNSPGDKNGGDKNLAT